MSGLNGYGGHGSDPRAGVDTGIFPVQALDETGAQTTTASHSSADARLTTGGGSSQGGWKGPGLGHREEVAVVPPASGAVFSPVLAIVDMTDGGLKSSVKEQKETVTSTEEPAKPNSPVKHRIINTTSAQDADALLQLCRTTMKEDPDHPDLQELEEKFYEMERAESRGVMTSDLRATFTHFIESTWISYSTTNLLKMLDLLLHESIEPYDTKWSKVPLCDSKAELMEKVLKPARHYLHSAAKEMKFKFDNPRTQKTKESQAFAALRSLYFFCVPVEKLEASLGVPPSGELTWIPIPLRQWLLEDQSFQTKKRKRNSKV